MKFFAVASLLLLLAACQGREVTPSSSVPPPPSSIEEESDVPVIESVELPPAEPEQSEPEPEDPYPAPILTDTEQTLLTAGVARFVKHIGGRALLFTKDLDKDTVLALCLDDIQVNKMMTAQFFPTDDEDRELIPADVVADTAQRLLGLNDFVYAESELYDEENSVYACAVPKETEETPTEGISPIMGAPDDMVAYTVETEEGVFLLSCKLLRLNGIPYLQLVSITVNR